MKIAQILEFVSGKLGLTADEFDLQVSQFLEKNGGWCEFEDALTCAYRESDEEDLHHAHTLLNKIYRVLTAVHGAGVPTPEGADTLARLRNLLERKFIHYLDRSVEPMLPDDVPSEDYAAWLHDYIALHPVASHQAYTRYLADEASVEDIRFYLVQESAIDANTDDFLAGLQIGAPNPAKLEIAANYWDEMGEGDHNLLHSDLFKNALNSFNISGSETRDALTLEALICGNLQTMLSLRREFFHRGVGYFAATEQLVPDRFKALEKGWERVGLPREGADYHLLHIEVDSHHTVRWYRHVVAELAKESSAARRHMLIGALYRLHTSDLYLTCLQRRFPSRQAISA